MRQTVNGDDVRRMQAAPDGKADYSSINLKTSLSTGVWTAGAGALRWQ